MKMCRENVILINYCSTILHYQTQKYDLYKSISAPAIENDLSEDQ